MLDIGTGTGLLAMMAVKSGADRATACEVRDFITMNKTRLLAVSSFSEWTNYVNDHHVNETNASLRGLGFIKPQAHSSRGFFFSFPFLEKPGHAG